MIVTRQVAEEGPGVVCPTRLPLSKLLSATGVHFVCCIHATSITLFDLSAPQLDLMLALDHCLKVLAAVDTGEVVPRPLLPELGRHIQELRRVFSVTTVLVQHLDHVRLATPSVYFPYRPCCCHGSG